MIQLPAPVPIATAGQTARRNTMEQYPKKAAKGMAYAQLVCGIMCMLLEIANLSTCRDAFPVGAGIWSGIFFTITGSIGIPAAKYRTGCFIISFMVLSIISAVVAAFGLSMATVNAVVWRCRALPAIIAATIFIELILAIVSSTFGCRVFCCNGAGAGHSQTVVYYAVPAGSGATPGVAGQSQVILIPASSTQPGGWVMPGVPQPQPMSSQGGQATRDSPPPAYEREVKQPIP